MSFNLSLLAAMKAKAKAAQEYPSAVSDEELAELGLAPSSNVSVSAPNGIELMAKMKSRMVNSGRIRNCGNCYLWKTCTKLHRAGRVSPNLCACAGHRFTNEGIN